MPPIELVNDQTSSQPWIMHLENIKESNLTKHKNIERKELHCNKK